MVYQLLLGFNIAPKNVISVLDSNFSCYSGYNGLIGHVQLSNMNVTKIITHRIASNITDIHSLMCEYDKSRAIRVVQSTKQQMTMFCFRICIASRILNELNVLNIKRKI